MFDGCGVMSYNVGDLRCRGIVVQGSCFVGESQDGGLQPEGVKL